MRSSEKREGSGAPLAAELLPFRPAGSEEGASGGREPPPPGPLGAKKEQSHMGTHCATDFPAKPRPDQTTRTPHETEAADTPGKRRKPSEKLGQAVRRRQDLPEAADHKGARAAVCSLNEPASRRPRTGTPAPGRTLGRRPGGSAAPRVCAARRQENGHLRDDISEEINR